jgi:hypothetical protein
MCIAVVAAPREDILFEDGVEDQADILCHDDPLGDTAWGTWKLIETLPELGMGEPLRPQWCPWS